MPRYEPATIERRLDPESGDYTGRPEQWQSYQHTAVDITPLRGRESVEAARIVATTTYLLRDRWQAGVLPEMRVRVGERIPLSQPVPLDAGGDIYEITDVVDEDNAHRWRKMTCTRRT